MHMSVLWSGTMQTCQGKLQQRQGGMSPTLLLHGKATRHNDPCYKGTFLHH
jgi:hypothetical protein